MVELVGGGSVINGPTPSSFRKVKLMVTFMVMVMVMVMVVVMVICQISAVGGDSS